MSPRVSPAGFWRTANCAAGKLPGHPSLVGRFGEEPLRAAGEAGPKTARRSQLLRDATFYSLRKICLWKFGYYCTEVLIWVRVSGLPCRGSTRCGKTERGKRCKFQSMLRRNFSKIVWDSVDFCSGGLRRLRRKVGGLKHPPLRGQLRAGSPRPSTGPKSRTTPPD